MGAPPPPISGKSGLPELVYQTSASTAGGSCCRPVLFGESLTTPAAQSNVAPDAPVAKS